MNTTRRLCALIFVLSVCLLCGTANAQPVPTPASPAADVAAAKTGSPDDVLATVGAVKITRGEMDTELERMGPQGRQMQTPDGRKQVLKQLIEISLFEQEANKQGLVDKPEQAQILKDTTMNMLAIFYMRAALDKIKVPDADIEKFYKDHQADFTDADKYHLFQMTLGSQEAADKAKKELAEGKKTFADVAKEVSTDNFKASGGDRGFVALPEVHPLIGEALKAAKPNEVTNVVKVSDTEFWVGKYSEMTKGAVKPLAEVTTQIRQTLMGDLQKNALADLRKAMDFKLETANLELLKKENISPEEMEKTLCTIGTEAIKIGAFLPELERVPPMFRAQLIDDFVGQFCDREIVRRHVDRNLDQMTKDYPEAVKAARRRVGVRMLLEESISKKVQVSDDDLKDFYTKNLAQFSKPEEVRAHHILVEKEEKAKEILTALDKKEKTFEDAAKADSKCPSGKRGGDLGFFSKGQMVKEFDEVAQTSEIGKVVGPVKTEFGYHLIRVDERKASGTAPLEEVKDFIKQQLLPERQKKALEEYVTELKKTYPVTDSPEKL